MKISVVFVWLILLPVLAFSQSTDTICFYTNGKDSLYLETFDGWSHTLHNNQKIGENLTISPITTSKTIGAVVIRVSTVAMAGKLIAEQLKEDYKQARKVNRRIRQHGSRIRHELYETQSQFLFISNKKITNYIYLNPKLANDVWVRIECEVPKPHLSRIESQYLDITLQSFRKTQE